MRIVHLWKAATPVKGGGGAVAMNRLHLELRKMGVDSSLVCSFNENKDKYIDTIGARLSFPERKLKKFSDWIGLNDVYLLNARKIKKQPNYRLADIVTIHGTHGYINYLSLPSLTKNKLPVFVLHDIWPLTGHCAVSHDCDRWKTGCKPCMYLDLPPAISRDSAYIEYQLKQWVYSKTRPTFVSPSTTLTNQAKESIIKDYNIVTIPHGVNTDIYYPRGKEEVRRVLHIEEDRIVLMMASIRLDQHHKGGDTVHEVLAKLPESIKKKLLLVTIGGTGGTYQSAEGIKVVDFGFVHSDTLKAVIYSAADIFLFPSRGESFGLVALESLACGTPVVAFDVGGMVDMLFPGKSGYIAKPGDTNDFINGVLERLEDRELLAKESINCPMIVKEKFTLERQAKNYINLYESLFLKMKK